MSLGDMLRLLRARRGGITPLEIEEALPALPKGIYRQMEQRYRAVGDEETIRLLAGYYNVPYEDLLWRLEWPRKALSRALVQAQQDNAAITLNLWNGQVVTGMLKWWDLGALALETETGEPLIIQRHAVERWSPRAPEPATPEEDAPED
jgi:sRNA-binding regulator protein Hfq